jgi:hypothetical protein
MTKRTFRFPDGIKTAEDTKRLEFVASVIRGWHGKCEVVVGDQRRSLDQNSRLWAMLTDVSRQVDWMVDGELRKIATEDWKAIFTAALAGQNRMARGLDGGIVMLGTSTSKMSKATMTELQDLIQAFGDERGIQWSDYAEEPW